MGHCIVVSHHPWQACSLTLSSTLSHSLRVSVCLAKYSLQYRSWYAKKSSANSKASLGVFTSMRSVISDWANPVMRSNS